MKITKNTTLSEVINKENVLKKFKVPCLTCPMMKMEMTELTLENICKAYNIDLESLLEELNAKK